MGREEAMEGLRLLMEMAKHFSIRARMEKIQNEIPHDHKCPDCGQVWTHTPAETMAVAKEAGANGEKLFAYAHTCPNCGKAGVVDKHNYEDYKDRCVATYRSIYGDDETVA